MRIVIDISGYHLRNMGDVSMLQVAAERLRRRLDECALSVVTTDPDRLERFVGGRAIHPKSRSLWNKAPLLPARPHWCPAPIESRIHTYETAVRVRRPRLAKRLAGATARATRRLDHASMDFVREIEMADAVVATGGGFLTDAFAKEAAGILQTLALGAQFGKPTFMFGQGIGPVSSPRLLARMAEVLPTVELITLREERSGPQLLEELGIPSERFVCTGDDAIELAHQNRPADLGGDLGVNLRLSGYAGVSEDDRAAFAEAIEAYLARSGRKVRLVPISFHDAEQDEETARRLLEPGRIASEDRVDDHPASIIAQVGRCRLVVTGSYHAAVFALSQGIPVVGWARNEYYEQKFCGLADLFGPGCFVVREGGSSLRAALLDALQECDAGAEAFRATLLEAAADQIARARAAYDRACLRVNGVMR